MGTREFYDASHRSAAVTLEMQRLLWLLLRATEGHTDSLHRAFDTIEHIAEIAKGRGTVEGGFILEKPDLNALLPLIPGDPFAETPKSIAVKIVRQSVKVLGASNRQWEDQHLAKIADLAEDLVSARRIR